MEAKPCAYDKNQNINNILEVYSRSQRKTGVPIILVLVLLIKTKYLTLVIIF